MPISDELVISDQSFNKNTNRPHATKISQGPILELRNNFHHLFHQPLASLKLLVPLHAPTNHRNHRRKRTIPEVLPQTSAASHESRPV